VWNAGWIDSIRSSGAPGEIKPAITQNVNGRRQILGFVASQGHGDRGGFLLLTRARQGGMVRRTFASF
jgi:hypothetical protein